MCPHRATLIGFVESGFVSRSSTGPVPVTLGREGHLQGFPVLLFVLTNVAILVMVSIVLAVLGSLGVLDMAGGQGSLLILCAVWGFGAAVDH